MTDETITINITARAVLRDVDKNYYVFEWVPGYGYRRIKDARPYAHSTSAYAQLGRITNRESQQAVAKLGR